MRLEFDVLHGHSLTRPLLAFNCATPTGGHGARAVPVDGEIGEFDVRDLERTLSHSVRLPTLGRLRPCHLIGSKSTI
jgi:hypothetical protein